MKLDFKKLSSSNFMVSLFNLLVTLTLLELFFYFYKDMSFVGHVVKVLYRFFYNPSSSLWCSYDNLGGTNWIEIIRTSITYFSFISLIGFVSFLFMMLSSNLELWYTKTLFHGTRKWIVKFRNMFLLPLYCHFLDYSINYYFKFPSRVIAFFLFEPAIILFDINMGTAVLVWVLVHFLTGFYNIYLDYGYFQENSLSIMNKKNYVYFMTIFFLVTGSIAFSLETGLLLETTAGGIVY